MTTFEQFLEEAKLSQELAEKNVRESDPTTLRQILNEAAKREVKGVREVGFVFNGRSDHYQLTMETSAEPIVVTSLLFNCTLVKAILELHLMGVDPFVGATWFWYEMDCWLESPLDHYAFYVVDGERIVNERVIFSDSFDYGFDPEVFDACDDPDSCPEDKGWQDARTRFWYRKFYRETVTGQLMVLRSDEPVLFHYPEGAITRRAYAGQPPD